MSFSKNIYKPSIFRRLWWWITNKKIKVSGDSLLKFQYLHLSDLEALHYDWDETYKSIVVFRQKNMGGYRLHPNYSYTIHISNEDFIFLERLIYGAI